MADSNHTQHARRVELRHAYEWTCDDCGRDSFARGIVPTLTDEDQADLRFHYGIPEEEMGAWIMAPDRVVCQHCGAEFETVDPMEDGSDEPL